MSCAGVMIIMEENENDALLVLSKKDITLDEFVESCRLLGVID